MRKISRHRGKTEAFHERVGSQHGTLSAFHYTGSHAPQIPLNQIGSGAAGATTVFNKTDITGGAYSIGTPLHPTGKVRRAGVKRGF